MARKRIPIEDRFWAKVQKAEGCWGWTGAKSQGYGYLNRGGRGEGLVRANRLSYEIHHGEIPDGMCVRHKCDNPECTNPDHLELGTHAENMADIVKRRRHHLHGRTHCANGHEYNEENTRIGKDGYKECRLCQRASSKALLRKKRGDKFGKPEYRVRTHCKHGHEFTEENTYVRPDGYKECMICRRDRVARHAARNR